MSEQDKLISVLKISHKEKVDACRQLAVVGGMEAVPALAALLGDEVLSHMARYALEPIPDGSVDEALREALGKLTGRPLVGVIGSIGVRRDAKAVEALIPHLKSPDPDVTKVTAGSLGKIATAEAAAALKQALVTALASLRPAVADACLKCAEEFLAQGKKEEALGMYHSVRGAYLPEHIHLAAEQGAKLVS